MKDLANKSGDLVKDLVNDTISRSAALNACIRGFEQGRTQGMIDSQGGKKMNKQRKVLITTTYNEMGIIIDTKAEEVAWPEYKPVSAEDFAKTMSENTVYGFMAWHGEALELMERQGFVICKKTM